MIDIVEQITLLIVSLIANGLSAAAGGGAGLLQLPALIFLGLPFSMALATHKIATVALGIGATIKHRQQKNTEWQFALILLAFGIPGVIIGANIILTIPDNLAEILLGCLTCGLGILSFLKKELGHKNLPKNRNIRGLLLGGFGLFLLGVFNGSLTSGTGLFVTMWLILWFGFDYKKATGYTMILVGIFWNGTGALTLALLTPVNWAWLPMLLLGSIIGGYLGAHVALTYGNLFIKRLFELITISVGISLIIHSQ